MKINIQNYYKNISKNNNGQQINFDISIILMNAKINKVFNKLLNLCIKYDIQLFNHNMNVWDVRNNSDILNDIYLLQKNILLKYSENINQLDISNNIIEEIEKLSLLLKKSLKDIEILRYLFENVYSNEELKRMCYNTDKPSNLITEESEKSFSSNQKYNDSVDSKFKIKKNIKYIAEYTN